jgi:outer membrane protein TolC
MRNNVNRSKELALNALKFVIGANEIIEVKDDMSALLTELDPKDLEGAIDFSRRPEYALILQGEKLQALNLDLAKASTLPTVAGFTSFSYGFQGNSFKKDDYFFLPTGLVGAKVSLPIWGGGGLPYTKQRAVLAIEVAKNQRLDL